MARHVQKLFNETLGTGLWREDGEILAWFGDWELLEPGLVPLPEWRPGTPARPGGTSRTTGSSAASPETAAPGRFLNRAVPGPG
jgi:S-adenosyl methyltransferase